MYDFSVSLPRRSYYGFSLCELEDELSSINNNTDIQTNNGYLLEETQKRKKKICGVGVLND